jgi:hypothetical protein
MGQKKPLFWQGLIQLTYNRPEINTLCTLCDRSPITAYRLTSVCFIGFGSRFGFYFGTFDLVCFSKAILYLYINAI